MTELADKAWVIVVLFAGIGVVGVLHCLACAVRESVTEHDLKVRVRQLRNDQIIRLRERPLPKPGSRKAA